MKTITRTNKLGMIFSIYGGDDSCTISLGSQSMEIGEGVEAVSQRWYNWQMLGQPVQVAFREWSPEHREFIMTGITPQQWDETFPPEDEKEVG